MIRALALATLASLCLTTGALAQRFGVWAGNGGAVAGEPVDLVIGGQVTGRQVVGVTSLQLVNSVLRAELLTEPGPGATFSLSVLGPALPAGTQAVEVSVDGGPPVAAGSIRIRDREPLALLPPADTTTVDFERAFGVIGVGRCPFVDRTRVDPLLRRVTLFFYSSCIITPPPLPQPFELSVSVTDPLEPGTWTVELIESDDLRRDLQTFEVLDEAAIVQNDEFEITIDWTNRDGQTGQASLVRAPSDDSALFWFFAPDNWEVMVKVLDGCQINGHYWVYSAATTDVAYRLDVERRSTGARYRVENPLGTAAPAVTDVQAFDCDGGAA